MGKGMGITAHLRAARRRKKQAAYVKVCQQVDARDSHACRVCLLPTYLAGQRHHVRFRSQGGADSLENLIHVCPSCHEDIHARRVTVTGNANDELQIERKHDELRTSGI